MWFGLSTLLLLAGAVIGVDVTYRYEAKVAVKTDKPSRFTSEYSINADFMMINGVGLTRMVFSNVSCSQYVGRDRMKNDADSVNVPREVLDVFTQPFEVDYDNVGRTRGVRFTPSERPWSMNMKRALAYVIQWDSSKINASDVYVDEESVYGTCPVLYSLSGNVLIKRIDPTACKDFKWDAAYSMEADECEEPYDNPLTMDVYRVYRTRTVGSTLVLESMHSIDTIALAAFGGESDAFTIRIDQGISFVRASEENRGTDDLKLDNVENPPPNPIAENTYDLMGQRAEYDPADLITNIEKGLVEIDARINDDSSKHLSYDNRLTFESIVQQLRLLGYNDLVRLFASTVVKTSYLFQLLPAVGTRSASLFICDLIKNQTIDVGMINGLVAQLPFYLTNHDNLEILTGTLSGLRERKETKNTAIFALATVLAKAKRTDEHADTFIKGYMAASNQDERLSYIGAMKNIKSEKIYDFLEGIIRHDNVSQLRSMAIWTVGKWEPFEKLYWRIVHDRSEAMEVRSAAVEVLLERPTMSDLLRLHACIGEETLRAQFVSRVRSMAATKAPCHARSALNARKLLALVNLARPRASSLQSYDNTYDFFDTKYRFGMLVRVSFFGDLLRDKFTNVHVRLAPQIASFNLDQQSWRIRLALKPDAPPLNTQMYDIWTVINLMNSGALDIHVVSLRNGRVTAITRTDDLHKYFDQYLFFQSKQPTTTYGVGIKIDGRTILPTDMGVPAMFYVQMPTALKHTYHYNTQDHRVTFKFLYDLHQLNDQIYGIKIYNPITDLWHGITRTHISKTVVPMDIEFHMLSEVSSELRVNRSGGEVVYESATYTQMFIRDVLGRRTNETIITMGEDRRENDTLWTYASDALSTSLQISVRDCERPLASSTVARLKESFLGGGNKNWGAVPALSSVMAARHVWAFMATSPPQGACTISVRESPSHVASLWRAQYVTENGYVARTITNSDGSAVDTLRLGYNTTDDGELDLVLAMGGAYKLTMKSHANVSADPITAHLTLHDTDGTRIQLDSLAKYEPHQHAEVEYDECRARGGGFECFTRLTNTDLNVHTIRAEGVSRRFKKLTNDYKTFALNIADEYVNFGAKTTERPIWNVNVAQSRLANEADVTAVNDGATHSWNGLRLDNLASRLFFSPVNAFTATDSWAVKLLGRDFLQMLNGRLGIIEQCRITPLELETEKWTRILANCQNITAASGCGWSVTANIADGGLQVRVSYYERKLQMLPGGIGKGIDATMEDKPLDTATLGLHRYRKDFDYVITPTRMFLALHNDDAALYLAYGVDSLDLFYVKPEGDWSGSCISQITF